MEFFNYSNDGNVDKINDNAENQNFSTFLDILYESTFRMMCALHADVTILHIQIQRIIKGIPNFLNKKFGMK